MWGQAVAELLRSELVGPLSDAGALAADLAEPLVESAPIAFEAAMARCPHDSLCQAYHAIWQYLRLAELVRSVRVDGPIYVATAERLARAGQLRRVLITATADYSMLAHLSHGASRGGASPHFVVIDQCATALYLNEWYAAKRGFKIQTIQADVLACGDLDAFDLICTHSLLTLLPVSHRPRLFEQWRGWLGGEGRICFSNRVWDDHFTLTHSEIEKRITAMAEAAVEKLRQSDVRLPCPADRFMELVRRYGGRYGSQGDLPALPLADLERWIADAGLAIEAAVSAAKVVADPRDRAPGPFPVERGPRMWFQLRRA